MFRHVDVIGFVSYVHPAAVINAAFCMPGSLLMLVGNKRGDHMKKAHECLLLFAPSCCGECFFNYMWRFVYVY